MRQNYCGTIIFVSCIVPLKLNAETFIYSGGCFWCTEADTEKLNGVSEVISGFTGGTTLNPRYQPGKWGDHREAAQKIEYDPQIISFEELVRHVFRQLIMRMVRVNFVIDKSSYRAIYYKTEAEDHKASCSQYLNCAYRTRKYILSCSQ